VNPAMLYAVVEEEPVVAEPAPKPLADVKLDERALRERLGGDDQLFNEVIQTFLEECPVQLAQIHAAMAKGDTDGVRAVAHALKGAAGNLSAPALFAAAGALEHVSGERRLDVIEPAWRQVTIEATNVIDALRRCESSTSNAA